MAVKVIIYSTQYCPHCRSAKYLLESKGVALEEVDLSTDDAKRQEMTEKTGSMTVPMIFIGDEFIGGNDELHALDESGELDKKLA